MDRIALDPKSRFTAPDGAFSRSPSRSPNRRQHSYELDPLLSNLSPTLTLEALEATQAVNTIGSIGSSVLRQSVEAATTSERALGIRAALAAKKVREWYQELMGWPWPTPDEHNNGFEKPSGQNRSRNAYDQKEHCKGFDELTPSAARLSVYEDAQEEVYWGSLPENIVLEYEDRIEIISDDMERLGLDELKDYVRDVHLATGSRRSSLHSTRQFGGHVRNYNHLDDFTAVITATIIQTLPTLTQLDLLLDTWSVRLTVLRQVPRYTACLEESQIALKSGWNAVGKSSTNKDELESTISREAFTTMRNVLESKILELGRRLDSMLDILEGREDSLPEKWIDSMDNVEIEFGTWVVQTERQVLENELKYKELNKQGVKAMVQADQKYGKDVPFLSGESHTVNDQIDYGSIHEHQAKEAGSEPYVKTRIDGAGSVYKLLSGFFGHEDSDGSSTNTDREKGHNNVKLLGGLQARNHSLRDGTHDNQEAELLKAPVIIPQNLTTSKSLPVNTEMEVLDTLEAEILEQKHGPAARPGPLVFNKTHSRAISNVSSDISPDTSYAGSATSEYFSNMSSPEIRDASRAEYFTGPVEVTTPSHISKGATSPSWTVSRQSSQRTERGGNRAAEDMFPSSYVSPNTQRSRASTFQKESGVNDITGFKDGFFPSPSQHEPELRERNASVVSVGVVPETVVSTQQFSSICGTNTIQVGFGTASRSEGYSSVSSNPWSSDTEDIGPGRPLTSALLRLQDEESRKIDVGERILPFELNDGSGSTPEDQSNKDHEKPADPSTSYPPPPIPPKSRHRFEDISDLGPGSTPVKIRQMTKGDLTKTISPTPKSSPGLSKRLSVNNWDDQLQSRISLILTDMPAHIRLTSGPEADAPEVLHPERRQDPQTPVKVLPPTRLLRSQSSVPSPMTLAPAHPKSSRVRAQNGDSEIKLYHLHQAGKAAPIKLYIRLVGENGERVMVRIGGGWADLGEYLKEYAAHHGRRSVSDGRFEIKGLSQPISPITPLTGHSSAHDTPRSRPDSPLMLDSRNRRLSELASSEVGTPITPEYLAYTPQDLTPRSRDSSPTSGRPPSRRSWTEDDAPLGLAGPRTKKIDVSPRKQAWVDGMVDQARNASAEKKKGGEGDFGDLGAVGGTKRVFLKSKKEG